MDRIDSHTPYDDEAVERAYNVTMKHEYSSADELFRMITEQLNSAAGGFAPTSTKEIAERLHINDIDELPNVNEYSFCMDLPSSNYDYRVFISSYQDGEGGDYAYKVEVWETDYFGTIAYIDNSQLFEPGKWHKGLIQNNKSNERK